MPVSVAKKPWINIEHVFQQIHVNPCTVLQWYNIKHHNFETITPHLVQWRSRRRKRVAVRSRRATVSDPESHTVGGAATWPRKGAGYAGIPAPGQDGEMINSLKISGVLQVGIASLLRSWIALFKWFKLWPTILHPHLTKNHQSVPFFSCDIFQA